MARKLREFPATPENRPATFSAARHFGAKRLDEMPPEWRSYATDCLEWYSERLRDRLDQTVEPANRFLSFSNAGGIALMLGLVPSFLERGLTILPLMISAICFTVGMLSLGLRIVFDVHVDSLIYSKLLESKKQVQESSLSPDDALDSYFEQLRKRLILHRIPLRLLSFIGLIAGSTVAIGGALWVTGS